MRVLVLGAAAGGGFPQWNSNSEASRRARAGDPHARPSTQSSLAVSADGERWLLLNASPDIRQQIEANPPLHPRHGVRHSPVEAVVLTNGDVDHVAGLLTLRERQPLAVYATPRVLAILGENGIFGVLDPAHVDRRPMRLDAPFRPAGKSGEPLGLAVEAFACPGKVALYKEEPGVAVAADAPVTVGEDTVGLQVTQESTGAAFHYLPGCAAVPAWLRRRLDGTGLLLFDGTLWRDDELIRQGAGAKTGRRMGHMSMSGDDGSIRAFEGMRAGRRIFIHINNTNPALLVDSPERAAVEAAGWEIARDGMEIVL